MRRTSRTIRRLPALARELAGMGNDLDTMSKRAHKLSSQVADTEYLAGPVMDGKMRVRLIPCPDHPEFDRVCRNCHTAWEGDAGPLMAKVLDHLPGGNR